MNASLLLPLPLVLLAAACGVEILRDVTFKRYAEALRGLLWGSIFVLAALMSIGPLLRLIATRV
jgi:hypothetical protein